MKFPERVKRKMADLGIMRPERKASGLKILLYHGVVPNFDVSFKSRFIGVDDFRIHLENYKKNYHVISLRDAFEGNWKKGRMNLVLTFDDGYRNNYLYAAPLLKEFNMPASFFITGMNSWQPPVLWADMLDLYQRFNQGDLLLDGIKFHKDKHDHYRSAVDGKYLNKAIKERGSLEFKIEFYEACMKGNTEFLDNPDFRNYYALMGNDEIKSLSEDQLFDIGSHGYYHNNLGNMPLNQAVDEVLKSKEYLENIINKKVVSIAFPDGSYSKELPLALHQAGFERQLACEFLFDSDKTQPWLKDRHEISWFKSSMGIFNYELVSK